MKSEANVSHKRDAVKQQLHPVITITGITWNYHGISHLSSKTFSHKLSQLIAASFYVGLTGKFPSNCEGIENNKGYNSFFVIGGDI